MEFTLHKLPRHQAVEQMLEHLPDIQHSPIETYLLFLRVASDAFVARQKHLARFGLSDDKPSALLRLLLAAQTRLSPSQLAERLGVTRATITDLVAGLERAGLLRRGWSGYWQRSARISTPRRNFRTLLQIARRLSR